LPIVQGGATVKATVANITGAGLYPGSFTTLASTGDATLGDATTDTVTVNGYMGVGGAGTANVGIRIRGTALTGATQVGAFSTFTASSAATASVWGFLAAPATAATAFTATNMAGFSAADVTKGAGSTITNQHGVYISDQTQGTNNFGVTSLVSSGAAKWNIYASGTASNYFAGNVGIGSTASAAKLHVVSSVAEVVRLERTATDVWRFSLSAGAFLFVDVTAASERWRVDTSGTFIWRQSSNQTVTSVSFDTTVANALTLSSAGNLTVNSPAGLGYGTGAGGTVTQATSRVTGVTLNKPTGAITLVSAAGLATFQSFTVTNSTVAATDVVQVSQKSGTDLYQIFVTAVAAGSFRITFATTGGVTIEQPVFNFAVIKGVTA
jgi:hypothetical protein